MSNFSIDIEKYYEELLAMGRQLKGVFCIQYPIYCIHSEISDSTPDPLDNLDKVIINFFKVKADFSSLQIGSIIGTSKALIQLRLDKLVSDGLLNKDDKNYFLTDKGISVFEAKTQLRLHKQSYDFYIDGITLKPLPNIFYNYYKSKLYNENYSYTYTNAKGETKIAIPFAPDLVHTPPDKNQISDLIFAIDNEQRESYGIPNGLQTIDEISFTKMSYQILVSVCKSENGLVKELIDGHSYYSLGGEHTYYESLRRNVTIFEPTIKERIQNLEFKLIIPFQRKENSEKSTPILTSNLPEIDRYKESVNKCFNFSSEDLLTFLEGIFGLNHIDQDSLIYEDDSVEINIRKRTLEESPNRQKLVSDLIRKRDYRIFNNNLERNVFLFYLYYSTDDTTIKKLIEFIELIKQYKKFSFADFLKNHSEYSENIRQNLILAGEYDLLEKYDIEKHMLKVN